MSKKDPEVAVQSALSKYKKRMKKVCVCGTIWAIVGILAIVIGILFLVYFSKYWGNDENWKRWVHVLPFDSLPLSEAFRFIFPIQFPFQESGVCWSGPPCRWFSFHHHWRDLCHYSCCTVQENICWANTHCEHMT